MSLELSIIIPTRNRVKYLLNLLQSLAKQELPSEKFEVVVVDNGSTDSTAASVKNFIIANPNVQLRYIFEGVPGLLAGRHRGVHESSAPLLTFLDDDVSLEHDYAQQVIKAFDDSKTALVGGPSWPMFETKPPAWVEHYMNRQGHCFSCWPLSIKYLGNKVLVVPGGEVWGLNFSIRRDLLIEHGGFLPDGYPENLFFFRGGGETAFANSLTQKGHRAIYVPSIAVTHHISAQRVTEAGFQKRFFESGVGQSYMEIRTQGAMKNRSCPPPVSIPSHEPAAVHARIRNAYVDGFMTHRKAAQSNRELLDWIFRKDYFNDYNPPQLTCNVSRDEKHSSAILDNALKFFGELRKASQLAVDYVNNMQWLEALRLSGQISRTHPDLPVMRGIQAYCLLQMGKKDEATKFAKKELTLDPTSELANAVLRESGASSVNSSTVSSLSTIYDEKFYAEQSKGSLTSAEVIVPIIQAIFSAKSVQDFGCGIGGWLRAFLKHGAKEVLGYDLNYIHADKLCLSQNLIRQGCNFSSLDFTPERRSDLAISLEVAEHLPESSARFFVTNLVKAAPCICFSAALPSQGGVSHINEQPLSYWVNFFSEHGYIAFDPIRPQILNNDQVCWWYQQNIICFINNTWLEKNKEISKRLHKYRIREEHKMTIVSKQVLERLCEYYKTTQHLHSILKS